MNDTTARAAIIARMKKLAAMTIERGATEAEAALASAKLSAMMQEHNIAESELSVRAEALECGVEEFMVFGQDIWWLGLADACGKAFSTRVWCKRTREDVLGLGYDSKVSYLRFFGFPTDRAASLAMFAICHAAVMNEQVRERSAIARQSFIMGMCARLQERISALAPRQSTQSTSTALMVLKDQLVSDAYAAYLHENGIRLRGKRTSGGKLDNSAFARGSAAGERVSLRGDGSALYGARQIEGGR